MYDYKSKYEYMSYPKYNPHPIQEYHTLFTIFQDFFIIK